VALQQPAAYAAEYCLQVRCSAMAGHALAAQSCPVQWTAMAAVQQPAADLAELCLQARCSAMAGHADQAVAAQGCPVHWTAMAQTAQQQAWLAEQRCYLERSLRWVSQPGEEQRLYAQTEQALAVMASCWQTAEGGSRCCCSVAWGATAERGQMRAAAVQLRRARRVEGRKSAVGSV
jgi:hypothetical protein